MTLIEANTVFNLMIPTYFAVRQEITTYKQYDEEDTRRTAVVCELYTTETTEGDGGAWYNALDWETLIQLFLTKKAQVQK